MGNFRIAGNSDNGPSSHAPAAASPSHSQLRLSMLGDGPLPQQGKLKKQPRLIAKTGRN
jgi:hypothetical protein